MQFEITPDNIHITSSFEVSKDDFERELLAMREAHPESLVWNRSIKSLKREWSRIMRFMRCVSESINIGRAVRDEFCLGGFGLA